MGITGLLPLLKPVTKDTHIREFKGLVSVRVHITSSMVCVAIERRKQHGVGGWVWRRRSHVDMLRRLHWCILCTRLRDGASKDVSCACGTFATAVRHAKSGADIGYANFELLSYAAHAMRHCEASGR